MANSPSRRVLLLDGGIGSELHPARRHASAHRLWGVGALLEAPDAVRELHRDYALADADWLTAATFRVAPYSLRQAGLEERAPELAAARHPAGCARAPPRPGGGCSAWPRMTTLEDCYRPDLVPPDDVLEREHAATVELLADAGRRRPAPRDLQHGPRGRPSRPAPRSTAGCPWSCHSPAAPTVACSPARTPPQAARAVSIPGVVAIGVNCTVRRRSCRRPSIASPAARRSPSPPRPTTAGLPRTRRGCAAAALGPEALRRRGPRRGSKPGRAWSAAAAARPGRDRRPRLGHPRPQAIARPGRSEAPFLAGLPTRPSLRRARWTA